MEIIFKFGEHYYEQGESSIILQVILTLLAGILGFGTSLFFFRKDIKKGKEQDIEKENKENQAWLKYFSHVLTGAVSTFNKQMELVDTFIEEQEKDYTTLQSLLRVPKNDFRRIHDIYSKDLFNAFGYTTNTSDWIKKYHNVQASLDFLEGTLFEMDRMHKRNVEHSYNLLLKVKENVDQIADQLASLLTEIERRLGNQKDNDEIYLGANKLLRTYRELVESGAPMTKFNQELLIPLIMFFEPHRSSHVAEQLMLLCKQARMKLHEAGEEMKNTVEQFKIIKKKTEEPLERVIQFEKALFTS